MPLKIAFPRLFKIAAYSLSVIAAHGHWEGVNWVWDLSWSRNLRPRDTEELESLKKMLDNSIISLDCEDSLIWTPHKSGMFSVKSVCLELAKSLSLSNHDVIKGFWKGLVPPRIELFTWLAILGKISTKEKLARIGVIPENDVQCVLCNTGSENCNHLFLHCVMARALWAWWLQIWELHWVFPSSLREAFDQWRFKRKELFFKKVCLASFYIIVWSLWKERNARIFNGVALSLSQLQELVLARLCWWIKGWGDPFPYSCDEVIRNPQCLAWASPQEASGVGSHFVTPRQWSPPHIGFLKWNVDASVKSSPHMSAIGGVLRDYSGRFMCMFSSPIPPLEINCAEILAIFRPIQISMASNIIKDSPIIVESDSKNAVRWCNEASGGPWNLGFQLNFIRNARSQWLDVMICHKGRESNMVADTLAKQGLTRDAEFLAWM